MEPWGATDQRADYPDLARIAATIRRWWWAVLLGALVGAAVGLAGGHGSAPTYEAQIKLLVGPLGGERFSALRAAGQQGQTYADLAVSAPVLRAARGRLTPTPSMTALRRDVSASADDVTRLLTITARAGRPGAAAATATVLAAELQRATQSDAPASARQLTVVEPAAVPTAPVGGRSRILVAIAALAGLLGTLTVLVVLDLVRGRIGTESELAAAAQVPVLGTARRRRSSLLGATAVLRDRDRVVVTAVEDDGTAARVALALAAAAAAAGAQVLVVDADPGPNAVTRRLALENRPGFAEALADPEAERLRTRLPGLAVPHGPRVAVLARGRVPLVPERAGGLLDGAADLVVLAAPPAIGFPGAVPWTRSGDGVVLSVRRGHTTRDRVATTLDVLERSGTVVLGAVLATGGPRRRWRLRPRPRPRRAVPPATPVAAGDAGPV